MLRRTTLFGLLIVSLMNVASANPLQKARKRLAETGMTDASLVAYDSCENGVVEACLQAAIMFCLDKQEGIARDTLTRIDEQFDRSAYKPEIDMLMKALKKRGAVCGSTTQKLVMLTGDLKTVARLILRKAKNSNLNEDEYLMMNRICADEQARPIGNEVLLVAQSATIKELASRGVACDEPGTLVINGVAPRSRIRISGTSGDTVGMPKQRLVPGKYSVSVMRDTVAFPKMDIDVKPGGVANLDLPAAVVVRSDVGVNSVTINGVTLSGKEASNFRFIPAGPVDITFTSLIHKPQKRQRVAKAGDVIIERFLGSTLLLRDDVAAYEANKMQRVVAYSSMAIGGGLLIASVASYLSASSKEDEAADAYKQYENAMSLFDANRYQSRTEALDDEAASGKTTSMVLAVAGLGAAAFGGYWLMQHPTLDMPKGVSLGGATIAPYATGESAGVFMTSQW